MKKFLLTAVLVLAVVTSLTAGTLAAYNQQLDLTGAAITAKEFDFDFTGSQIFSEGVALAPGDSVRYKFVIANASEMPVDFEIATDLTGDLSEVLVLTIEGAGDAENPGFDAVDDTDTREFYVTATWPYADDAAANATDMALIGKTASLKVMVTGTSVDEGIVNE